MAVLEMERGRTDIRLCHRKPNSNLKYLNISEGKEKRNMIGERRIKWGLWGCHCKILTTEERLAVSEKTT